MASQYDQIKVRRPKRSAHNLSTHLRTSMDMGQVIPIYGRLAYPGDKFQIGVRSLLRFQPMIAPLMHNVKVYTKFFFVPLRLLWDNNKTDCWEYYITKGLDSSLVMPPQPRWVADADDLKTGSLYDYFGFPLRKPLTGKEPTAWLPRAYNHIFNDWFRNEWLEDELDITIPLKEPFRCAWEADYFTSAGIDTQAGPSPAIPFTGTASAIWDENIQKFGINTSGVLGNFSSQNFDIVKAKDFAFIPDSGTVGMSGDFYIPKEKLNDNIIDLSNLGTFTISDFRYNAIYNQILERNIMSGERYPEWLQAHFGVRPQDSRLQRSEYIGGTETPFSISDVLQTSESTQDSPQATMAGHGLSADANYVGSYFAQEHGVLVGLMFVKPETLYQQGIAKEWLADTPFDYYLPLMEGLPEQPIEGAELYVDGSLADAGIFGYQGFGDNLRTGQRIITAEMRSGIPKSLDVWHLGRYFENRPALNDEFIRCKPSKRIFAITDESADSILAEVMSDVKAIRCMPYRSIPGITRV